MKRANPKSATSRVALSFMVAILSLILPSKASAQSARALTAGDVPKAPPIEWREHLGEALDGSPIAGRIGTILVPENRSSLSSRTIEIRFVHFQTSHPNPGPPIFFLAGGPGGSGIDGAATLGAHPQIRLLEGRDVYGIDQRGTGLSGPELTEDVAPVQLPLDRAVTREELAEATRLAARRTVSYWRERGVDLSAYNSEESADDLEAVRQALGLPKIALWGTSYGSHLGLAYLRRHGEYVERAVLTKVEGPNHTFKLPSTVQTHLEQLHRLAAEDATARRATPDLLGSVERLLDRLEEEPVRIELDGRPITLGALDLQIALARALASSQTIAEVPAALRRFENGDWRELAEQAEDHRQTGIYAMALMMDCGSGASAERGRRLERETSDPAYLLGDALLAPFYPEACAGTGYAQLDDAFRAPIHSDVPVLFVSGTLDVRTPPENVEEILPGFSRAVHLVIENAGHESRELMSPEYRGLLQAFLRGESLESVRITLPEPFFAEVDGGAEGDAAQGE